MRVLLDISWLGLGHLYPESRSGSFRALRELAAGLVRTGECELVFCANLSSVAFSGSAEYLRTDPALAGVQLMGPSTPAASEIGRAARRVHRTLRGWFPNQALPGALRSGARLLDQRVHPPVTDATPAADVFHSPCAPLPPRRRRAPPRLLTIYDVVHPRYAALYDAHRVQSVATCLGSLKPGDRLITTSLATRDDMVEMGIAGADRISVVPLAAHPELFFPCADVARQDAVRTRLGIPPGPYLLSVGLLDVRKNLGAAVEAFTRLVRQEGYRDLSLVVVGQGGSGTAGVERAVADARAQGARVVMAGFVPDVELAPLYSGALGFVFPSLHEGFGIPPLEAMQCGAPVIASNRSSIPEVVGDAALVVDPQDVDALSHAMYRLYHDGALREDLRARSLARAALFSWDRTVAETLAVYRSTIAA
jgi:glycosyltransferase involved in cell wall biosynthesis